MLFEMVSCGGCRTCEMVCSFHHKGEFIPSLSSIKILERENEPGFLLFLVENKHQGGIPCDSCGKLDVPLCLQYCKEREDLEKILKDFWGYDIKDKRKGRGKRASRVRLDSH
jgi:Fe-S-cluster-containing hydrogenase component 2